jgi:hypothetical protein
MMKMSKSLPLSVVVTSCLLSIMPTATSAPPEKGKKGRVKAVAEAMPQVIAWESSVLGKTISCGVRYPESKAEGLPVVVYLKNLPSPRLGELDDKTLIEGFLQEGLMVIEVDYEGDPRAASPEMMAEIDLWYAYLYETMDHSVDKDWIYIIPAGYTIDRGVTICEVGTRPVGMDVIHPSGQTDPVPLMLQITSHKVGGKWINLRACYVYGLLTTGYAGAFMDVKLRNVSPLGDVFPEKRAARLLRANASKWNLSGKLGVTGHSKGSTRAANAAFINDGEREADQGPHADQSDRFQVALLSAGQHAMEFLIEDGHLISIGKKRAAVAGPKLEATPPEEMRFNSSSTYVTPDDPPAFLCVGELDAPFRVAQMKRLAEACKKAGLEYRFIIQPDMEHIYIPDPKVIGEIFAFFDRYLKTAASE